MNRSYNIVWNAVRNMYMVVAEFVRGGNFRQQVRCVVITSGILLSGINSVYADELGPQTGASIDIHDGDTVTSTTGGKGIDSSVTGGAGVQIDGKATIDVSGTSGAMIGVNIDNGVSNSLGVGTQINVNSAASSSGTATGLFVGKNQTGTGVTADHLDMDITSMGGTAYGIQDAGKGGGIDIGQGSDINVSSTGSSYSYGVYLGDGSGNFKMDSGTLNVMATTGNAEGINSAGNASIDLGSGTKITTTSQTRSTGIDLGKEGLFKADYLMLNVVNTLGGIETGINLENNSSANLGRGSVISLSGNPYTVVGITLDGGKFTADNLTLNVATTNITSNATGRGIILENGGSADLGSGSTITVSGSYYGQGIEMLTGSGAFTADHLTVDVAGGGWLYGIQMGDGQMDLGEGSSVSATGDAETIWITGGKFTASGLTVKTQQSIGINVQGAGDDASATIGPGTIVDGRLVGKSGKTSGICVSDSGIGGTSLLNFNGTADNRNAIYAVNGYGASSQFSGQTLNISNTDITMSGSGRSYGLWAIGDNSLTSAGVINAENLSIDMITSGPNSVGVMVQQGGIVNLTGDTTIKTDGGVALRNAKTLSSTSNLLPGGTITGAGKMNIEGDIVSAGWGTIDLTMEAGSHLMGATLVNPDVNQLNPAAYSTLNLTLKDQTQWDITDDSSLTALTSAGKLVLKANNEEGEYATLHAENMVLQDSSTLEVDYLAAAQASAENTPLITGNNITLDGDLHLINSDVSAMGNITSDEQLPQQEIVLIDADNAIKGNFSSLSKDASILPDYLAFSGQINANDNTQYLLGMGLSWYVDGSSGTAATTGAHGTFTLAAGNSFEVTQSLVDVSSDSTTGWNGKTLTKKGDGTLILSGSNTYSGGTDVEEGELIAANTQALGEGDIDNSGLMILDADGVFDLNQSITTHYGGITQIEQGSTLRLNTFSQEDGSVLNLFLDATSTQPVITAQEATLDGDLNITGFSIDPNRQHTGTVTVIDAANEIQGDFDQLTIAGMPASLIDFINVEGRIARNDSTNYDVTLGLTWYADRYNSLVPANGVFTLAKKGYSFTLNAILEDVAPNSESGWDGKTLTKKGEGTLILDANNTYSGATLVEDGTLLMGPLASVGVEGSQQNVNIATGAAFGGDNATVNGRVENSGALYFAHTLTINGDVANDGAILSGSDDISLSSKTLTRGQQPGNTLLVNGNYAGNGGSLTLNTWLGDDSSATDMMKVSGDTSGNTTLFIKPTGGNGAATNKGIEVIDVGGASNGVFTQGNQVQAGLYEYRLYQDESDGDWYLRSQSYTPPDPDPDDGGDDDGGDVPVPPTPDNPQYRPDIGVYIGNQWMARNLQIQTLYDREGSQYRSGNGDVWARFKTGNADSHAADGNIDIDNNYSQFQLGGDILTWTDNQQSVAVGLMGSYINADTDSTGNRGADGSRFSASGNVSGYNLGIYATWFADAQSHAGMYVDSWYQYGIYNNSVDDGEMGSVSYDSSANAVSLEMGYRYAIALENQNSVSLTPQAQVTWQNYHADSVTDNNGTSINEQGSDSWTTRLGLRVDGTMRKAKQAIIQPFAEVNWLHSNDDVSVAFDGARVKQGLPENRGEMKLGIQANIDSQWSIRVQAVGQKGSEGYNDLSGSLNVHYIW